MRYAIAVVIATSALVATPLVGFAATPAQQAQSAAKASKAVVPSHATTGIVKSINATNLVITRPGKSGGEMTFELNASTHREGTLEVGSPVSIRYREEGKNYVATAISLRHQAQTAAHNVPSGR